MPGADECMVDVAAVEAVPCGQVLSLLLPARLHTSLTGLPAAQHPCPPLCGRPHSYQGPGSGCVAPWPPAAADAGGRFCSSRPGWTVCGSCGGGYLAAGGAASRFRGRCQVCSGLRTSSAQQGIATGQPAAGVTGCGAERQRGGGPAGAACRGCRPGGDWRGGEEVAEGDDKGRAAGAAGGAASCQGSC